jgi:hypothetical protein
MKLFEVTGISKDDMTKARREKKTHDAPMKLLIRELGKVDGIKTKVLGSGVFSVAIGDQDSPGTVRKVTYGDSGRGYTVDTLMKDAYFNYLMEIAKGSMKWNPYLPKVYSIKFHESSDGLIAFELELERLHDFDELNSKEVMAIGSRMYGEKEFEEAAKKSVKFKETDRAKKEAVRSLLLGAIHENVHGRKLRGLKPKDSRLRQATRLIGRVNRSHGSFFLDMHSGNVMIRRTPVGAQLVITDPLAD